MGASEVTRFLGLPPDTWTGIAGIAAVVALLFAFWAWRLAKRTFKREMVNGLFAEYSTGDFGHAVKRLHEEFEDSTKKKVGQAIAPAERDQWVKRYQKLYEEEGDQRLHFQRRQVSAFYQKIAFYAWRDWYVTGIVKKMWGGGEHSFVTDLLMPIETIAIPELLHNKPTPHPGDYPYTMWVTWEFWRRPPFDFRRIRRIISDSSRTLLDIIWRGWWPF